MIATIEGSKVTSKRDLMETLRAQLFPDAGFGYNLDSLHDVLGRDVPRPITIVWVDSFESFKTLGAEEFGRTCAVLGKLAGEETDSERFVFRLR